MSDKPMIFVVYEDVAGKWRWRATHGNGEIVADSGQGYESSTAAERAAWAFVVGMQGSVQVTIETKGDEADRG